MDCRIGSNTPRHHNSDYSSETVRTNRRRHTEVAKPEADDKDVEGAQTSTKKTESDKSDDDKSHEGSQVDDTPSWRKHMRFLERSEHGHHHRHAKAENERCKDKSAASAEPSKNEEVSPPAADGDTNIPDPQDNESSVSEGQPSAPVDSSDGEHGSSPIEDPVNSTPPVNENQGNSGAGNSSNVDSKKYTPVTLPVTAMDKTVANNMNRLNPSIAEAAKKADIEATWMQATYFLESRGDPSTVSINPVKGDKDIGLGQISYHTINDVVKPYLKTKGIEVPTFDNLYDPQQNILASAYELRSKLELAKESMPGVTDKNKLMKEASALYLGHENDDGSENVEVNNSYATAAMLVKADIEAGKGLKDEYVVNYVKDGKKLVGKY